MKYTRFEIPGRKNIGFERTIIQFFVVVPVLAIIIGYAISSFIIIPRVQKGSSVLSKTTAIPVFKINKIDTLYFLQAGLYSSREKAALVMEGINQKGFKASLGLSKGMYRIILGTSNKLDEMQKSKELLTGAGYTGIVNKIDIQMLDKTNNQELKLIGEYMNFSSNLIMYQQEFVQKLMAEKVPVDEKFKNSAAKLQTQYDMLISKELPENVKKELSEFHKNFMDNYNSSLKNAGEGNLNDSLENISNAIVSLLDFYKTVSQNYSN